MSRVHDIDIEQAFTQVVRLANSIEPEAEASAWTLRAGTMPNGTARMPWAVVKGDDPILVLGYSRRDALTALNHMASVLRAVVVD